MRPAGAHPGLRGVWASGTLVVATIGVVVGLSSAAAALTAAEVRSGRRSSRRTASASSETADHRADERRSFTQEVEGRPLALDPLRADRRRHAIGDPGLRRA